MQWLKWLLGSNPEADRLRANVGRVADTMAEINDNLRANAGLAPVLPEVKQLPPRQEVTGAIEGNGKAKKERAAS